MLKETDMQRIRSTARSFMWLEPEPTPIAPMIVRHPYTDSGFVPLPCESGELPKLANIMEDKAAFSIWQQKFIEEQIDTLESPVPLTFLITKPYRMAFLKYAMPYMSQADFSHFLASVWISVEAPHSDPNFTQSDFVKMFKQASPEHLMSEEEQALLQSLPEEVTIYRGVTSYNAENVKGLSWTLKQHTAEWFAQRYSEQGKVYQATVNKANIIAILTDRNESEVIVDPKILKDISLLVDFGDENTIKERRHNEMKLEEFETKRAEIIKDVDWTDIHTSPDFQCNQTNGFPTSLCVCWEKGKAWLELNDRMAEEGEDLSEYLQGCASFGIRDCTSIDDFNELLERLGEDALQTARLYDEDIGMGGIQ